MIYAITPVPAPRMTQADKWQKRACVMRYFNFKDEVKKANIIIPESPFITFYIPMPPSWKEKKREKMVNQPHLQTPDIDNLTKALLDSVYKNDSHIWDIRARKLWGRDGCIHITQMEDL